MAIVKPFKGLRTPNQEVCEELACLPYDAVSYTHLTLPTT